MGFEFEPITRRRMLALLGAAATLPAALSGPARALPIGREKRYALVIGNGAYAQAPLRNSVNDARALVQRLRDLEFDVTQRENLSFVDMLDAMKSFSQYSRAGEVRLFFYAGHGLQLGGRNFLVPIDAVTGTPDDVEFAKSRSIDVAEFVEMLDHIHAGVNIVILDACRNAPPTLVAKLKARGLAAPSGLAPMVAPSGTLIAFSTSPNASARDGASGSNSPYTRHLLANITQAGLPVEQLFKRVRVAVSHETQQGQIPWETSSLMGDFCFRPGPRNQCGMGLDATAAPDR